MKSGLLVGGFWLRVVFDALTLVGFDAPEYWKKRKLDPPGEDLHWVSPYSEVVRLWRTAVDETGDPLLGLHAAAALPVQTPNVFSYIMMGAANLREALTLTTRFQPLVMNARLSSFEDGGDHFKWRYQLPLEPTPLPQQIDYGVTIVLRMCDFIHGPGFRSRAISFAHPAQGDLKEYERILGGPIRFLAPENSIVFDRDVALKAGLYSNPTTLKMLVETLENLMAQRSGENWTARLSAALQPVLAQKNCTLDEIARSMHVSTRTLQRNLANENATFQDVLDETRRKRALELVLQPQFTLAQVAQETGFADGRAFNRAFQRWTGQPPSIYRDNKLSAARTRQTPQLRVVGK